MTLKHAGAWKQSEDHSDTTLQPEYINKEN